MTGLFERALGDGFGRLPTPIRAAHGGPPTTVMTGTASIEGAASALGRLLAAMLGFPRSGSDVAAEVRIRRDGGKEIWTRRFGDARFASEVTAGPGPGRLTERFGLVRIALAITSDATGFSLAVSGWALGRLRLPSALAPSTNARAFATQDGGYGFDIAVHAPLAGRLVRYRGRLELPCEAFALGSQQGVHPIRTGEAEVAKLQKSLVSPLFSQSP